MSTPLHSIRRRTPLVSGPAAPSSTSGTRLTPSVLVVRYNQPRVTPRPILIQNTLQPQPGAFHLRTGIIAPYRQPPPVPRPQYERAFRRTAATPTRVQRPIVSYPQTPPPTPRPILIQLPAQPQPAVFAWKPGTLVVKYFQPPPIPRPKIVQPAASTASNISRLTRIIRPNWQSPPTTPRAQVLRPQLRRKQTVSHETIPPLTYRSLIASPPRQQQPARILVRVTPIPVYLNGPKFLLQDPGNTWSLPLLNLTFTFSDPGNSWSLPLS